MRKPNQVMGSMWAAMAEGVMGDGKEAAMEDGVYVEDGEEMGMAVEAEGGVVEVAEDRVEDMAVEGAVTDAVVVGAHIMDATGAVGVVLRPLR